jgi:hypothetical protein
MITVIPDEPFLVAQIAVNSGAGARSHPPERGANREGIVS